MLSRVAYLLSWTPVAVVLSDKLCCAHHETTMAMAPAIPSGATVLVSRATSLKTLCRGEVVVISSMDGKRSLLRRVIGLPGDCVRPRAMSSAEDALPLTVVPHGFVWVQADVRELRACEQAEGKLRFVAEDSDDFGSVPAAMIKGRAIRFLPSFSRVVTKKVDRSFEPSVRYT